MGELRIAAIAAALLVCACGDDGGTTPPVDESGPVFEPTRLLQIEIEVAPADWDTIRVEHYDLFGRLLDNCPGPLPIEPYTVVPATVTIDGERIENVGLRKKGFLGSANRVRPSLKLSFDEFEPGREWKSLERLTLNNNQQDDSLVDTCLAYRVFRDAGLPAPRCNWARVRVNGVDLGVYSNVESVRRRYIGRFFDDNSGNLYEGQVADLRSVWVDNYEEKPGNSGDRSDLAALVAAAGAPDASLLASLDPVLDVDAFLTFWATEVLVGHWDGFGGNRNNHYLYRDPSTGKFHFLPWGPDSAFGDPNPFLPAPPPPSLWANNVLASRLHALPEIRQRYRERMESLLTTAWNEAALMAEVDRAAAMFAPYVHVRADAHQTAIANVRNFIMTQRQTLTTDLATDPRWTLPLASTYCVRVAGTARGTFSATRGNFPPANPFAGSGTFELTLEGTPVAFNNISAAAGPDNDPSQPRIAAAAYGLAANGDLTIPLMLVDPELYSVRGLPVDGYDVFGILLQTNLNTPGPIQTLGFLQGTMTFTAAPDAVGETVTGSFDLEVIRGSP